VTTAGRLEVGRVVRAHGLAGEVLVHPVSDVAQRFAPGTVLHAGPRALEVERARPHQARWRVKFAGIDDRTAAEALRGAVLEGEPLGTAPPEGAYWVHELVGAAVVDRDGTPVGTVEAVQDNPAHDLLVLDSGALVPVVFIVEQAPGRIVVDLPDGLLDL
jgi:16S rRNA processing protein RimM